MDLQAAEGLGRLLVAGDGAVEGSGRRGGCPDSPARGPAFGQPPLQLAQLPTSTLYVFAQPVAELQQPVCQHVHLVPGRGALRVGGRRVAPRAQQPGGGGA